MKTLLSQNGAVEPYATDNMSPWAELLSRPTHSAIVEAIDEDAPAARWEHSRSFPLEPRTEGQHVVIEAERELVLRCGEASITLTRDGKVFIRGAYVESHASGVQRIKGGCVRIN